MLRLIIPVILALLGTGGGIYAARILLPPLEGCTDGDNGCEVVEEAETVPIEEEVDSENGNFDYVKFANQFVIPVVRSDAIQSLVVMSLTLEVATGTNEEIFTLEPKLRDQMLRVLFDHANAGGFDGQYTSSGSLERLRRALRESARAAAGAIVNDVLVADIVRQDL